MPQNLKLFFPKKLFEVILQKIKEYLPALPGKKLWTNRQVRRGYFTQMLLRRSKKSETIKVTSPFRKYPCQYREKRLFQKSLNMKGLAVMQPSEMIKIKSCCHSNQYCFENIKTKKTGTL